IRIHGPPGPPTGADPMPHTTHYQLAALTDADLRELIDAAEAELADRHASREAERRWQTVLPLDRADAELASDGLVRVGEEDWPESIGAVVCSRFYTAAEYERVMREKGA